MNVIKMNKSIVRSLLFLILYLAYSQVNLYAANIQLYYFWISGGKRVVSDEEAVSIARQYPERNTEYYLHSLLNDAKTKRKVR